MRELVGIALGQPKFVIKAILSPLRQGSSSTLTKLGLYGIKNRLINAKRDNMTKKPNENDVVFIQA